MKNTVLFLLILALSRVCSAQNNSHKGPYKTKALNEFTSCIMLCDTWTSPVCPRTDFNTEADWKRPFYYKYGKYSRSFELISSEEKNSNQQNRAIILDTINMEIHFPFQDIGGPGKAGGSDEKFTIYLKNVSEINWQTAGSHLLLDVSSTTNSLPVGCYFRNGNCNKLKYELYYLSMSFRSDDIPYTFKSNVEKYLKALNSKIQFR